MPRFTTLFGDQVKDIIELGAGLIGRSPPGVATRYCRHVGDKGTIRVGTDDDRIVSNRS